MLVLIVSPRAVNCRFWSHLECLGWKVNLPIQVSLRAVTCIKKFTVMSIYFRFSFRAQYTLIGWSPLGFNFHFLTIIPVTFISPLSIGALENVWTPSQNSIVVMCGFTRSLGLWSNVMPSSKQLMCPSKSSSEKILKIRDGESELRLFIPF